MSDLFDSPADNAPPPQSLAEARDLAAACTRCSLYRNATQTVFGEGTRSAPLMLVGEQPGDQEDLQVTPLSGRPATSSIVRSATPASTGRASG